MTPTCATAALIFHANSSKCWMTLASSHCHNDQALDGPMSSEEHSFTAIDRLLLSPSCHTRFDMLFTQHGHTVMRGVTLTDISTEVT